MRQATSVLGFLVLFAALAHAQGEPVTIYAESFRKGSTQITEETFEVRLTSASPKYRELIKDSSGHDRYELTITPRIPEGDNTILSWFVRLKDLHHTFYTNLLLASPQVSNDPANNLYWLRPDPYAPVPPRARRIIRVEGFYVVFQVKNFHFTPPESPYLDTMVVQFALTNSDPRSPGH